MEVKIPANSDFVGYGHLQHVGWGLNREPVLRYDTYGKLEGTGLKHMVALAYDSLLGGNSKLSRMHENEASGVISD